MAKAFSKDVSPALTRVLFLFQIEMKGGQAEAEQLKDLVKSFGIREGVKCGPRVACFPDPSNPSRWVVSAGDLLKEKMKEIADRLLTYSKSSSYDLLTVWTDTALFDFSEAPLKELHGFIGDPGSVVFPPEGTLRDGMRKCLENAGRLADDVETLLSAERDPGHASFLLLASIEEVGKACMIHEAAKEAGKVAVIREYRNHKKKLCKAAQQLKEFKLNTGFMLSSQAGILLHNLSDEVTFGKWESFGTIRRGYNLYVNYFPHSKDWKSFKDMSDPLTEDFTPNNIKTFVNLIRKACEALLKEIEHKSLRDATELKDLFRPIINLEEN